MNATDAMTGWVVTADAAAAAFFLEVLRRSGAPASLRGGLALAGAGWLALLMAGLTGRWLLPADIGGWAFFGLAVAGVSASAAAMLWWRPAAAPLAAAPQEYLMLVQGIRVFIGAAWLAEGALGLMPAGFAVADGLTHVTAGFLALKSAVLAARGEPNAGELWFANAFGLLDIVTVAGGIAFVLLPKIGPYHNVMYAVFFVAPLFVGVHAVSLMKLVRERAR